MANTVQILGKIQRINNATSGKMCFLTIQDHRQKEEYNYIDCVSFHPDFINKWFSVGKWCYIEGHLHTSKYNNEYKTDIIIDNIHFTHNNFDSSAPAPEQSSGASLPWSDSADDINSVFPDDFETLQDL